MKKIIGVLAAVGVALALVGCDTVTPTGGSLDLVATWTNVSKQYTDLSVTPAASNLEGTWTGTFIKYPTTPTVTVQNGVTNTNMGLYDTTTATATVNVVVQASGNYVKTTTFAEVWTDRAAPAADTSTVTTTGTNTLANGSSGNNGQLYAGSKTTTITETVTVSVVGSNYQEVKKTETTVVYTGKGRTTGVAYVAADNSSTTTTTTSYITSVGGLSYNSATGISTFTVANFPVLINTTSVTPEHTVQGTTVGAPDNRVKTTTTTTTWAFAKDGTYTETIVEVVDQPAQDAVAATASAAAVLATAAGTTTETSTVTGTYTTQTYVTQTQGYTATASQYLDKGARLYMYEQAKTVSSIGTGYLISTNFPATAKTSFNDTLTTQAYDVVINKNTLIVNGNKVYTKPASN